MFDRKSALFQMDSVLGNDNGNSQSGTALAVVKDRRAEALGDLRVLPDEVLCTILTRLTPRDVARLSCVSRCDAQSIKICLFFVFFFFNRFQLLIAIRTMESDAEMGMA